MLVPPDEVSLKFTVFIQSGMFVQAIGLCSFSALITNSSSKGLF